MLDAEGGSGMGVWQGGCALGVTIFIFIIHHPKHEALTIIFYLPVVLSIESFLFCYILDFKMKTILHISLYPPQCQDRTI